MVRSTFWVGKAVILTVCHCFSVRRQWALRENKGRLPTPVGEQVVLADEILILNFVRGCSCVPVLKIAANGGSGLGPA